MSDMTAGGATRQMRVQANAIRAGYAAGTLDYQAMAVESIARSWEHCAAGRDDCAWLALMDALACAVLHAGNARAPRWRWPRWLTTRKKPVNDEQRRAAGTYPAQS